MTELSEGIKREVQQVKNFVSAGKEINRADHQPGSLQRNILRGLLTIMPGEVKAAQILESPQYMAVIDAIGGYEIGLNDRIDFEGSRRADISDITGQARKREEGAKVKLMQALQRLPESERTHIQRSIEISTQEVEVVERWIREKRDNNSITFEDVDVYRNLVNAVSNVTITSLLLGPEQIRNRYMRPIEGQQINLQVIKDRYGWVFGESPRNDAERAVMIMHNMGMAAQIIDDWHGVHIDELLNIPSYATEALRASKGDRNQVKVFLAKIQEGYESRARKLGIGIVAAKGAQAAFVLMQKANEYFTKKAHGYNGVFRDKVLEKHPQLREFSYVRGKLDLT